MKVKDLKGFPKPEVPITNPKNKDIFISFANGFNLARSTIGELTIPKRKLDKKYLKDIIYTVTQYLPNSDNEIAILNDRLYNAISKRIGK